MTLTLGSKTARSAVEFVQSGDISKQFTAISNATVSHIHGADHSFGYQHFRWRIFHHHALPPVNSMNYNRLFSSDVHGPAGLAEKFRRKRPGLSLFHKRLANCSFSRIARNFTEKKPGPVWPSLSFWVDLVEIKDKPLACCKLTSWHCATIHDPSTYSTHYINHDFD
jgi:hypothetical protein